MTCARYLFAASSRGGARNAQPRSGGPRVEAATSLGRRRAAAGGATASEPTRLEVEETGRPRATMRDGELPFAVDNTRFFAGACRSLEGTGAGALDRGYTSLPTR